MNRHAQYRSFLCSRYRNILCYTALICSLIGLLIALPVLLLLFFPDEWGLGRVFLLTGTSVFFGSLLIRLMFKPDLDNALGFDEGAVIVVLSWTVAIIAGSVPFVASGLNWTQAVFETTSGWTTTGLSVVDVASVSPLILFFRSLMQLAGGAGLAILMLSALTGPAGVSLTTAEGRQDQLVPNVRQSTRLVVSLYFSYVLVGILALKLAGMSWFDAINHSFCALSTGGFSTQPESIGNWNAFHVELVMMVLMLLGTTNFLVSYALWKGKFRLALRNAETHLLGIVALLSVAALFWSTTTQLYAGLSQQFRAALFQSISALSTTGYTTSDLRNWDDSSWLVIIFLMLIGGGVGSTAGGIKQFRICVLIKGISWNIKRFFLPAGSINQPVIWVGENRKVLTDEHFRHIGLHVFLYITIWLLGSYALTLYGHSFAQSFFEYASTIGTVGLSVGVTSIHASNSQLWVQILGMVLGRLEFWVVFLGFLKLGRDFPVLTGATGKS
ncbi:MAG: TrkH family potassium uptake protein [Desulfuromonadales bacterium]|nr:TrkH family potassium uptake protein [Desulfuromonadales bacterium]MBN2791408.1 TrkH family potassium uptake protein [Desulfuromonadales bacterium]